MNIIIDQKGDSRVAIVEYEGIVLGDVGQALDLMSVIRHDNGCGKVVVEKRAVSEDFFDLKTGLAGEILQKYVNYDLKIAIVGDFSGYTSKSLRDFIYESNNGAHGYFASTRQEALDRLHGI